jgi:predicted MFS family arabinose efflux permease
LTRAAGGSHVRWKITAGAVIGPWFPVAGWALPNALTNVGVTVGSAAAAPLVAWLVLRAGWRQSFVLLAPAAFIAAAIWYWASPALGRSSFATLRSCS